METIFRPIYLPENMGLGNALREALNLCTYELVARMDSDDICAENRFQLQLDRFLDHPELDIVGGNITEFDGEESNITGRRVVPEHDSEIKQYMKKRCPMNHVAVMYKKHAVQSSGGYQDWFWNEDYYLWIRMMEHGCVFGNLPENVVNVRGGAEMSARRGGWKYFKSEEGIQRYMLRHKLIGVPQYLYNTALRFGGEIVATNRLRKFLFKFMRKPYISGDICNDGYQYSELPNRDYPPFSVAMSVYGKDKSEWFDRALESVLIKQSVKPNEVVLIVDGPISQELQYVIDKYIAICAGISKS